MTKMTLSNIDRSCGVVAVPVYAPPAPAPAPVYAHYAAPPPPPHYPHHPAYPDPHGPAITLPGIISSVSGSLLGGLLGPLLMPILMLVGMLLMQLLNMLMPTPVVRARGMVQPATTRLIGDIGLDLQ